MITDGVLKSAGIVTFGAVLSRLLGFGREAVLAARFGATAMVDAFQSASLIPINLFFPIAASLPSALIPAYTRRIAEGGREAVLRTCNNLLNIVLLGATALALILFLMAPQIATLVAPGFDPEGHALVASLTRWMAPAMVFLAAAAVVTGILHSQNLFLAPSLAGIPMNGLIIFLILGLSATAGIQAAAMGTLAGAIGYLIATLAGLRGSDFRYRLALDFGDPGLRLVGRLFVPLILITAAGQMVLAVNRILASGLPDGSIAYLSYAIRVAELPLSIFAAALTTAIYPTLSHHAVENNLDFRRYLLGGVRVMIFAITPMAVGVAVLREPFIRLLFERGAFNAADTAATAGAVLYFSVGLVPAAVASIWGKGFYALGDTRSPLLVAGAAVATVLLFSNLLIGSMAHTGLALAASLAQIVTFGTSMLLMRRRLGTIGGSHLSLYTLKVAAASTIMAGALLAADAALTGAGVPAGNGLGIQLARVGMLVVLGSAVYGATAALLGLEEVTILKRAVTRVWTRLTRRVAPKATERRGG